MKQDRTDLKYNYLQSAMYNKIQKEEQMKR